MPVSLKVALSGQGLRSAHQLLPWPWLLGVRLAEISVSIELFLGLGLARMPRGHPNLRRRTQVKEQVINLPEGPICGYSKKFSTLLNSLFSAKT
jgi:hypothetical protein